MLFVVIILAILTQDVSCKIQTCLNCGPGPGCVSNSLVGFDNSSVTYGRLCTDVCQGNTDCQGAWFNTNTGTCKYYPCVYAVQEIGTRFYRNVTIDDCPIYEVHRYIGRDGSCGSGGIIIAAADQYECLNHCLDTPMCRGAMFDGTMCHLHFCESFIDVGGSNEFWRRICMPECANTTVQTCQNCQMSRPSEGGNCPDAVAFSQPHYISGECNRLCKWMSNCKSTAYNRLSDKCYFNDCGQIIPDLQHTAFRKTCNTDCARYELFRLDGYAGNCTGQLDYFEFGMNEWTCLERCLDTAGCLGTTFKSSKCTLHNCNEFEESTGAVFNKRVCIPDCDRIYTQKCFKCSVGPDCQSSITSVSGVTHSSYCNDLCANQTSCNMAEYDQTLDMCYLHECTQVTLSTTTISYRRSCSSACPTFKLELYPTEYGSCPVIGSDEGGVNLEFCIEKCLDIDDCKAVTYNPRGITSCLYHSCQDKSFNETEYTASLDPGGEPSRQVVFRVCGECEKNYMQKCLNCDMAPECQTPFIAAGNTYLSSACYTMCSNNSLCNMGIYRPTEDTCYLQECSSVVESFGNIAYRRSCNSDCLLYTLEQMTAYSTACTDPWETPTVHHFFTLTDCVNSCLDTENCRAVFYRTDTNDCTFFSCSNFTDTHYPGNEAIFTTVKRVCRDAEPTRDHIKTCLNCKFSDAMCQQPFATTDQVSMTSDCNATCNDPECHMTVFAPEFSQCYNTECTMIQQQFGYTAYRYSYTKDCPLFEINVSEGNTVGDWNTCLMYEESSPNYHACQEKCLDLEFCRAASYITAYSVCQFYNCTNTMSYAQTVIHMEINCNPEVCSNRSFYQTCINCRADDTLCQVAISKPANYITANCNITRSDSNMAVFHTDESRCYNYECTKVKVAYGSTTNRRSCSADCPLFKLVTKPDHVTAGGVGCILSSDTGIPDYSVCTDTCLDMDTCIGVTYYTDSQTCVYDRCGSSIEVIGANSMYVERDCDVLACDRLYTQKCLNCKYGPRCPASMHHDHNIFKDYSCKDHGASHQHSLVTWFWPPHDECTYLDCTQVTQAAANTVYRKTCVNDCLRFEIDTFDGYLGGSCDNIASTVSYENIPDALDCLDLCLDMADCRAITLHSESTSQKYCTFHRSCPSKIPSSSHVYIEIICDSAPEPIRNYMQTCHNCGPGPDCPSPFISTESDLDYPCIDQCTGVIDCKAVVFNTSEGLCSLHHCGQVKQTIGPKVYRKAVTADCLEYEIFTHTDHGANCSSGYLGSSDRSSGPEFCLERCLDLSNCRGTEFNSTTMKCFHYSCTDHAPATGNTFIKRVCKDVYPDCNRTFNHTCINCSPGPGCQDDFATVHTYKPRTCNTTMLGTHPDLQTTWYDTVFDKCSYNQCKQVRQSIGRTMNRLACAEYPGCHRFELFIMPNHKGSCSTLRSIDGGLDLYYCIEKCLDMADCLATTYNEEEKSCHFHDCDNYTAASDFYFAKRVCVPDACTPTTMQTCVGCSIGRNCQNPYAARVNQFYTTDCSMDNSNDNESEAVWYNRTSSSCLTYQCSQVKLKLGHVTHRLSCNTECPHYEVFILPYTRATCDVIGYDQGGVNKPFCLTRCLDMPGCIGVTYNVNLGRCEYHNCTDTTASANSHFIKRICSPKDCDRNFTQICLDCNIGPTCQSPFESHDNITVVEDCFNMLRPRSNYGLIYYNAVYGQCHVVNCTEVTQDMYGVVLRKSCSANCTVFQLFTMVGYYGTCSIIGSEERNITLAYCIEKCLDMDACRGVTYEEVDSKYRPNRCDYHDCTDRAEQLSESKTKTFVKRVCITETAVAPSYTQTCLNCDSVCTVPVSFQPSKFDSQLCDTSCTDCDSVMYVPQNDTCKQFQCDFPTLPSSGGRIMRKTSNTECLQYEIHAMMNVTADCASIAVDEGGIEASYCIQQCMDLPGCSSVMYYESLVRSCTYHNCLTYIDTHVTTPAYFIEKICINRCPMKQTCVNCKAGPECQTALQTLSGISESSCLSGCAVGMGPCIGVSYDSGSGLCKKYQCTEIGQSYGNTFFRETCTSDCLIYEVYTLDNVYGVGCGILFTEVRVKFAHLCFKRCLDTVNCRAITFHPESGTCEYHTCDCFSPTFLNEAIPQVFMWRYCLDDVSFTMTTPPPGSNVSAEDTYRQVCSNVSTTSSSTSSSSSSSSSSSTVATTTAKTPIPIFIRPCICNTGLFADLTNEEIIKLLLENITLNVKALSATRRRLTSASDDRQSAEAIGSTGSMILGLVFAGLFILDISNIVSGIKGLHKVKGPNNAKNAFKQNSKQKAQSSSPAVD